MDSISLLAARQLVQYYKGLGQGQGAARCGRYDMRTLAA